MLVTIAAVVLCSYVRLLSFMIDKRYHIDFSSLCLHLGPLGVDPGIFQGPNEGLGDCCPEAIAKCDISV